MIEHGTEILLRLAAFTIDPNGGNPAGVWIGRTFPPDAEMQRVAAEVGYSETAFLVPDEGAGPLGHPPVIGGNRPISRAPAIVASALTWARSIAARMTRSRPCATSSAHLPGASCVAIRYVP